MTGMRRLKKCRLIPRINSELILPILGIASRLGKRPGRSFISSSSVIVSNRLSTQIRYLLFWTKAEDSIWLTKAIDWLRCPYVFLKIKMKIIKRSKLKLCGSINIMSFTMMNGLSAGLWHRLLGQKLPKTSPMLNKSTKTSKKTYFTLRNLTRVQGVSTKTVF